MHDLTPPFIIMLPTSNGTSELICERVARNLPGRRLVCAGTWRNQSIYTKLFLDPRKARKDWKREQRGIELLLDAGIPTPSLLYSGYSQQRNSYILVLSAIEPAQTLNQAWKDTTCSKDREALLKTMARVFAQHHNAGIVQNDPHLNNFLVAGDTVYTLDGSDISKHSAPIPARHSLRNIAAFFSIIYTQPDDMTKVFFNEYATSRNISLRDINHHSFTNQVLKTKDRNIKKYLKKKIFRECTAFSKMRSFKRLIMLSRHYDSPGIRQVISTPGDFINSKLAKPIKQGNTATVASLHIEDRDIVIKHYRVKGILHGLRKACLHSRAEKSWINAHRLQRYSISTAPPVALIMNTIGPLRLDSYVITEHVPGPDAATFINSPAVSIADKKAVAGNLCKLLRRLAENRLHHGDLKATNIIICGTEPVLIDLDSMQQYRSDTKIFRQAFKKDLERFKRNWSSDNEIHALLQELTGEVAMEFL